MDEDADAAVGIPDRGHPKVEVDVNARAVVDEVEKVRLPGDVEASGGDPGPAGREIFRPPGDEGVNVRCEFDEGGDAFEGRRCRRA